MKNLVIIALVLMSSILSYANTTDDLYVIQGNDVVVEKVIPFEVSMDIASAAVNSYFVTNLNDSNHTLKNSSNDYYVAKIHTPKLAHHSMGQWYTRGELTIEVRFKENRMKVSVSCSSILQESTAAKTARYCPVQAAPLAEKHNIMETNIPKKAAEETFQNLIVYMAGIVDSIGTAVENSKVEEDW